jgi:hydrogenase maturation protein HypF
VRRLKIAIRGVVQGVGFRPFIYRLANQKSLAGWVRNGPQGVSIEVEGPQRSLDDFLLRLPQEKPPLSFIQSLEYSVLEPVGYPDFRIRRSLDGGEKQALILPDIATCRVCIQRK